MQNKDNSNRVQTVPDCNKNITDNDYKHRVFIAN